MILDEKTLPSGSFSRKKKEFPLAHCVVEPALPNFSFVPVRFSQMSISEIWRYPMKNEKIYNIRNAN